MKIHFPSSYYFSENLAAKCLFNKMTFLSNLASTRKVLLVEARSTFVAACKILHIMRKHAVCRVQIWK